LAVGVKQATSSGLAWSKKGKVTRRERFPAEMDKLIPWARLLALIEPHYPSIGQGRPPIGLERMHAASLVPAAVVQSVRSAGRGNLTHPFDPTASEISASAPPPKKAKPEIAWVLGLWVQELYHKKSACRG